MNDLEFQFSPPEAIDESRLGAAFANPWMVASLALGIGLAIDTLALHHPPGIGLAAALMVGLFVAASVSTLLGERLPTGTLPLLMAGLVAAGFVGVRTSPVMIGLNAGGALAVTAVLAQLHRHGSLREWSITVYGRAPFITLTDMASGAVRFGATDMRDGFGEEHSARLRSVAIGVLIGAPLLLVFGGLFASADVVFSDYLDLLLTAVVFGSLFWRVVFTVVVGAAVAGLWRAMRIPEPVPPAPTTGPRLDRTTGTTVLALLVTLFLFFIVTQVLGSESTPRLHREYSEDARRGFFQLVTVAFLVLNLLLLFDWLTRDEDRGRSTAFDRLAVLLIGLTGLVMVSALGRMRLYVEEFGLTELRFYTTAFMFWLGFVLVWFVWTILQNRQGQFALGLLVSALVWIVALDAVNPDAFIVKANWNRHESGANFSDRYNSELSLDSLQVLVDIRQAHVPGRFCFIERRLALTADELALYRQEHGILADSWGALQARRRLADLELIDPDNLHCGDPRTIRVGSLTRPGD